MRRKYFQIFGIILLVLTVWYFQVRYHELLNSQAPRQNAKQYASVAKPIADSALDLVVGIPSIKRPRGAFYLGSCVSALLKKRSNFENMMIVVFLADEDSEWVATTKQYLITTYKEEVEQQLIQIIQPTDGMYDNLVSQMTLAFGDPPDHSKWRTKENLDMAHLMEFAYMKKAKYFLGLEDDVMVISSNYATKIVSHAEKNWRNNTIFGSYSTYPSIAKLFKRNKLPMISGYLKLFAGYKPLDWLYYDLMRLVSCGYPLTNCVVLSKEVVINYPDSLFDHIGKVSSNDRKNRHKDSGGDKEAVPQE